MRTLLALLVISCNAIKSRRTSPQVLSVRDSRTGVMVQIVGSMHYNEHSIRTTQSVIRDLAERDALGAVVIESCRYLFSFHSTIAPVTDTVVNSRLFYVAVALVQFSMGKNASKAAEVIKLIDALD